MCIGKPECQKCETCGVLKYQLWADRVNMHPRGCPWEFERADQCPDFVNMGKRLRWMIDNGLTVRDEGRAIVAQLEAAGVDLMAPAVDFTPQGHVIDLFA